MNNTMVHALPPYNSNVFEYDAPATLTGPFYILCAGADVYMGPIQVASWRESPPQWRFLNFGVGATVLVTPMGVASYVINNPISVTSGASLIPTGITCSPATDALSAEVHFRSLTPYFSAQPCAFMTSPIQHATGVFWSNVPSQNLGDRLVSSNVSNNFALGPLSPIAGGDVSVAVAGSNPDMGRLYFQGSLKSTNAVDRCYHVGLLILDPALVVAGVVTMTNVRWGAFFGPFTTAALSVAPLIFEASLKMPQTPTTFNAYLGIVDFAAGAADALTVLRGAGGMISNAFSAITHDYGYALKRGGRI
jgi:hypothetical protein